MPDNVTPITEPNAFVARRSQPSIEERLERVAARLTELANELPQAMSWVEAEMEALRGDVRQTLKMIAERTAADREHLTSEVVLLRDAVSAMGDAVVALRDEVIARQGALPFRPVPGRPAAG